MKKKIKVISFAVFMILIIIGIMYIKKHTYTLSGNEQIQPVTGTVIGVFEVAHGTNQQIQMSNREIFIRLCLCGATSFFLVHNHPSGETIPSKSDISNTQEVKKAGELMGIELLDHIIIGKDYCSFREHNLL